MGVIIDASQRVSIDKYVQQAKEEGAEVFQACATFPKSGKGLFYPPSLITKVQPMSTCVQEEVRLDHYLTSPWISFFLSLGQS